jgi:type I pantothenate kinase
MDDQAYKLSPYRVFTRAEWAGLRAGTPLTLAPEDLGELQGLHDHIDMDEVVAIYLPLSRLLNLYVAATQALFQATQKFLHSDHRKMPYVIGIAGSVAVGKSTTARILQRLLARWPHHPKVDLVPTDGFLLPNAVLEREGLLTRNRCAARW